MQENTPLAARTPFLLAGAVLCTFLWGAAFPVIKLGYGVLEIGADQTFRQILFAGERFLLAGVLAWIIGCLVNRRILFPKKSSWKAIFLLSLFQTALQYLCFYLGLARTSGVKASVIEGAAPFLSLLLAALCFHQEKLTARKAIGCLVGFLGVLLIESGGAGDAYLAVSFGDLLIFLATLCSALAAVAMRKFSQDEEPYTLSSYQFVLGGIFLTVAGAIGARHGSAPMKGGLFSAARANGELGKALVLLLILAAISAVAFSLWGVLLKSNEVSRVTVFTFLIPVFGALLSMLLLRESASQPLWVILVSLLLVSAGTVLVQGKWLDRHRSPEVK